MSGESLTRPITTEQEYLAAILAELRALRQSLERPQPAPSDVIELREQKKPKKSRKE